MHLAKLGLIKANKKYWLYFNYGNMVSNRLSLPLFNFKTHFVYLLIYQLSILNNNNISLLINKKSSIFKFSRLVYLIMLYNNWIISLKDWLIYIKL